MILFKKAVRTIWRSKKSYIACVALMAIGIAVYVSFNMLYLNLQGAMNKLYEDQRFADGFATLRGIPMNDAAILTEIEGVEQADASLVVDARVNSQRSDKVITLRLSSYDPDASERLNDLLLESGTLPRSGELLAGASFCEAHGLVPGDTISMTVYGREYELRISGIAYSPEYVYPMQEGGAMLPDNEAFGFAFLPVGELARITGRIGEANTLAFRLSHGTDWDAVKIEIEDTLAKYGLISAYPRKDHSSHMMLEQEIESMGAMATSMPMLFIVIAVIILYIMMGRIIEQERGQIGILKAFGLTDREIMGHYLGYGLVTGLAGGVLGLAGGVAMSGSMTDMFLVYYHLPSLRAGLQPKFLAIGLLISLASGVFGTLTGARGVLKLSPGDAMRPAAPPAVKGDLIGKLPFLRAVLTSNGFMAVRSISRNRFRSVFVAVGISFSFAILAFMAGYNDMMDKILLDQYTKSQLYDMKIGMRAPQNYTALVESAYRLDGVSAAEGILELPAELSLRNLSTGIVITALPRGCELYKIYDNEKKINYAPPQGGIIISRSLAGKLRAGRGDILSIRADSVGVKELRVPVLEVVSENLGVTAYMELEYMCELLGVPSSASGVILRAEDLSAVKEQLRELEGISSLNDQVQAQELYDELMSTYASMMYLLQLSGIGIAYAIITNTSSIALSERKREYATLRVLGMSPGEIGRIMGFEYWILTVIGIVPGIPLTGMFKSAISGMIENDLFSIPTATPVICYIQAGVLCAVAVVISNLSARRRIASFDMVEVLKERE